MAYGGSGGNIDPNLKGKFAPASLAGGSQAATGSSLSNASNNPVGQAAPLAQEPAGAGASGAGNLPGGFKKQEDWSMFGRENKAWFKGYVMDNKNARDEYRTYLDADTEARYGTVSGAAGGGMR
jgi:hypothetical protein